MTTTEIMKLYILKEVLYDYTDGMCVIAAESLEHCKQLFIEEFGNPTDPDYLKERRQKEFDDASVKVIEGVNHPAGVVSYVYGGG
jgi:hypothetical protein